MSIARNLVITIVTATLLFTPPLALAANQTFSGVHYLVSAGKKPKQVKARLVLAGDSIQIQGARGATYLKEISYSSIKAATYSRSKHPRWKTGLASTLVLGVFAIPLFFMKGKKHWLTFQADGDYMALRLSKKNYAMIIAAVEGQTGVRVERISE